MSNRYWKQGEINYASEEGLDGIDEETGFVKLDDHERLYANYQKLEQQLKAVKETQSGNW